MSAILSLANPKQSVVGRAVILSLALAFGICGATGPAALAVPTAPSGLSATPVSAIEIHLSWIDNASDEEGLKIERSTDGTTFIQIGQVLSNTTSYRSTTLAPSTTYYYRVRAYNTAGNSGFSNDASDTTLTLCSTSIVGWGSGPITP